MAFVLLTPMRVGIFIRFSTQHPEQRLAQSKNSINIFLDQCMKRQHNHKLQTIFIKNYQYGIKIASIIQNIEI